MKSNTRYCCAVGALCLTLAAPACAATTAGVDGDRYFKDGQATLTARRAVKADRRHARNVILFVADGMDPTTVAAARIYDGQTRGEEGEENFLSFERFPFLAMAKTYNTDAQTPDSAGTMSAMTTGVKTGMGIISLSSAAVFGQCATSKDKAVPTLGELSERAGPRHRRRLDRAPHARDASRRLRALARPKLGGGFKSVRGSNCERMQGHRTAAD